MQGFFVVENSINISGSHFGKRRSPEKFRGIILTAGVTGVGDPFLSLRKPM